MVKKKYMIAFLFLILFLQNKILCQKIVKPDSDFFNNWLREDYYDGLQKQKTPGELFKISDGVMFVYFDKKTNSILLDWNFHEGVKYKFTALSSKKLKLILGNNENAGYLAELIKEDNQTKLVLDNNTKKIKFIKLDKKYLSPYGVYALINDSFFTGVFAINGDPKKKVKFTTDGKVNNWDSYTHYVLHLEGILGPKYDEVYLQTRVAGKIKKVLPLHWKKNGNKIELFSVSDNSPYAVIKNKYVELIKIK